MKRFRIKQDKSRPYLIIGALVAVGVALISSHVLGIPYAVFLQFLGVISLVMAIYIMNYFILSEYYVEIDDLQNDISHFPKLYIYSTRKNNIAHKSVFVTMNRVISIERVEKIVKNEVKFSNLCANIKPKEIYMITYHESGEEMRVYCDFDASVYLEIKKRIELYSGLDEEDIF